MIKNQRKNIACLIGATGMLLSAPNACADDLSSRFDVHGYGQQAYFQTSGNTYMGADNKGTWDNNFLGLVVAATIDERSKVWAQLETSGTDTTHFTWFFMDYQLTDTLRAHAGLVKMPLGLYNEIIDTKFLQLSSLEPALYQQPSDMVLDSYEGVGLDYEQDAGDGHLTWQIYAGNVHERDPSITVKDRRLLGGRVTYRTPVDGLRFMASVFRQQVEVLADNSMVNEDRAIFSADYVNNNFDIKAEYGTHKFLGVSSNAAYVQAGYTFADKWTPYVRYDYVTTDKSQKADPSYYQKTAVIGINYKISSNLNFRMENQFNQGYALPVASEEVTAGSGKPNWNLFVSSINFAF